MMRPLKTKGYCGIGGVRASRVFAFFAYSVQRATRDVQRFIRLGLLKI
jgi:hypothetical protein